MDHRHPNQRRDPYNFDIEAQGPPPHSRPHSHRRSRSVPRHNKSEDWIVVEEESAKSFGRARHRSKSHSSDGRDLMLGFMHRGRGLVDLNKLRWARGNMERNTKEEELKNRRAREQQLRREEGVLIERERRINRDRDFRAGQKDNRDRRDAADAKRRKEDHEWDIVLVRRAEQDWRRANEDMRREEEDREWHLWFDEQRLGHDDHHVRVSLRGREEIERRPGRRDNHYADDTSSESADLGDRSKRPTDSLRRSSSSIWHRESHGISQSAKQVVEVRARQMDRRRNEDRLRVQEDDVRREEDIERAKELRDQQEFQAAIKREEQQDQQHCTGEAAARGELAQRRAWVQTQWQKLLLEPDDKDDKDDFRESDESLRTINNRKDRPPKTIAEMHRHGSEQTKGRITFALPWHSKMDVYTTGYIWHTTTDDVPKRTDAWLVRQMKDFYKLDVRGTRGFGLHLLNTISFAKFVRFERCRSDAGYHPDEFDQVLEHWTCTGQQFLVPLKYSSEYGKFRWMISRHEEGGIQWMTMMETLMKQVREEHDVKIVVFLYESLDYLTASIAAGIAIILGIAAAVTYGLFKKDIRVAMEIGGSLTGLLGLAGGAGGWANQFGRETPSTPAGHSYAYDTMCRRECIEHDGKS